MSGQPQGVQPSISEGCQAESSGKPLQEFLTMDSPSFTRMATRQCTPNVAAPGAPEIGVDTDEVAPLHRHLVRQDQPAVQPRTVKSFPPEPLLTTEEAAAYLAVRERMIRRLVAEQLEMPRPSTRVTTRQPCWSSRALSVGCPQRRLWLVLSASAGFSEHSRLGHPQAAPSRPRTPGAG